ncbi:Cysteine-rich RLK (receptor-like protein kinase) 8 [Cucumis melo var. makuwa]|uniref:Cysteine-rich RLK (Receptor-like protein kinase) 8 n=1 Tax=Cucumis melo var. makuwa TaxID=1194695 RepID=A0A5A7T9E0_CUCMM|nr:Cysteine-rich RLK (receptor-like protein kinase) 8 [Cucumis melo var. makuwa]TYK19006.1 Cysteine-rich RLK (receptor-like protein kinase) 8 [Cucumis melo var. makuwa]
MEAVKRILGYLKTTPGKGLMFRKIDRKTIEAYTDLDWTGSVVDRKSTSSYCIFVWGNLLTWRSKKQSVVARSSAEAECRAISLGIYEKIWLQKVLSNLHRECETPLKLFCDNKAAISIANNPVQHDRNKHDEIDRHFIKERLDSGSICISYIPSSRQVTDVLTKGLLKAKDSRDASFLALTTIPQNEEPIKTILPPKSQSKIKAKIISSQSDTPPHPPTKSKTLQASPKIQKLTSSQSKIKSPNPSCEIQIHTSYSQQKTTPQSLVATLLDPSTTKTPNLEDPLTNQGMSQTRSYFKIRSVTHFPSLMMHLRKQRM